MRKQDSQQPEGENPPDQNEPTPPRAWQQRREQGEFGAYGNYGASDDQWDVDLQPPASEPPGHRYGVLPHGDENAPKREFQPGYEANIDAEPYRDERIYGSQSAAGAHAPGIRKTLGEEGNYQPPEPDSLAKNVPRHDDSIHEDICQRLSQAAGLDVGNVSLRVVAGLVALEGTVPYQGMKHAIENIARNVAGVQGVENHVRAQSTHAPDPDSKAGLTSAKDASQLSSGRQP